MGDVFNRRMLMSRLFMSGEIFSVHTLTQIYGIGRHSIERDIAEIGGFFSLESVRGCKGGYRLVGGVSPYHDTMLQDELEVLNALLVYCDDYQRLRVLNLIRKFGPYIKRDS